LHPTRHDDPPALDWHASYAQTLGSAVCCSRVSRAQSPQREFEERFALDVLAALPDNGLVLESDPILRWLDEKWEPKDSVQLEAPPRRRLERLPAVFHRKTKAPITDG
jgi:hypothetical protein